MWNALDALNFKCYFKVLVAKYWLSLRSKLMLDTVFFARHNRARVIRKDPRTFHPAFFYVARGRSLDFQSRISSARLAIRLRRRKRIALLYITASP